jgi:hypothetical protein
MNNLDRLQVYLQAALAKVKSTEFRQVSDALLDSLPDVVRTLAAIITDGTSTTAERLKCLDILQMFWIRLLSNEQSANRTAVHRTQTAVKAKRVKVAEKHAAIKITELRQKADKQLGNL